MTTDVETTTAALVALREPRGLLPTWSGIVGGLVGFTAALTPSLLPRPPLYLGLIAGAGAAIGYSLGVLVAWFARTAGVPSASPLLRRRGWTALALVAPIVWVGALLLGSSWQNDVRALVGEPPSPSGWLVAGAVSLVVASILIVIGRGLRRLTRFAQRVLSRFLPRPAAFVFGLVIVTVGIYALFTDVVLKVAINAVDGIYSNTNKQTDAGVTPPSSPLRSGGPGSLVSWDSLGRQGRLFTGSGPTQDEIASFTGKPALQPIRAYVGLDTAPTARDRAALAVAELRRTGAFDRKVLVLAGATGTGWIEPPSIAGLEYMWGGDTAIVTAQYSFLPSWISFLVDQERAQDQGRELADAVTAAWSALPQATRPKLIVYGLSLGSFSIQAGFSGAQDFAARTDGALLVGTPGFTEPWGAITAGRDEGSPQWRPVYRDGAIVRFGSRPADFASPSGPWGPSRTAYLQHASDPVVWWNPDLILSEPDWLREPPGSDRTDRMMWFPVLTFLQVSVDQFFGVTVPDGHGHNYASQMAGSWASVVAPDGWTPERTTALQAIIDAYSGPQ